MNKRKKKKDSKIALYVIILWLLLMLVAALIILRPTPIQTAIDPLTKDDVAVQWRGNQQLPQLNNDDKGIAIPSVTNLVFAANQTTQQVNFVNPEYNDGILFKETLYVSDTQIWQSGYFEAGKGYYQIELSEPLAAGEYNAFLQIRCFTEDGNELNGADLPFILTVQ